MNTNLATEIVDEIILTDEALTILPTLPQAIAQRLKPLLEQADIETYKHFLVTMYHYTLKAEEQLLYARDKCTEEHMRDYFTEMAREERGHYLLAKRDYEEFGLDVTDSPEPAYVKSFRDYWYNLGQEDPNEFVGAMYVFESVATAVGADVVAMMKRLELTKRQSRWLLVHLEADIGHGDEAWEMVKRTVRDNPSAMLRAAEEGAKEWTAVFEHAFSKPNEA